MSSQASAVPSEHGLRQADLEQARLVQAGDLDGIVALLHPAYAAHLTNGHILDHERMLDMVRDGSLARERFVRTQERVILAGDSGVVMGLDRLESPPPLARNGERTRHYTNIYVWQGGRWRLLARHFHLLP